MVCFSRSRYIVPANLWEPMCLTLNKYFNGVKCGVSADDPDFDFDDPDPFDQKENQPICKVHETKDNKTWFQGRISSEFFQKLKFSKEVREIVLMTSRFWESKGLVQALPLVPPNWVVKPTNDSRIQDFADRISGVIRSRHSFGACENYIEDTWNPKDDPFFEPSILQRIKSLIKPTFMPPTYDELARAIQSLNLSALGVTRIWLSPQTSKILILINDHHFILIDRKKVCDISPGGFDLDDGFLSNTVLFPEWQEAFRVWRKRFDESNGATWNEPILQLVHDENKKK